MPRLSPARLLALTFVAAALLGGVVLALPVSAADGRPVPFLDALFTATSAVCVTGLTVVETGTRFSTFGQVVILFLIQVGGLGIMTFATIFTLAMGERLSIPGARVLQFSHLPVDAGSAVFTGRSVRPLLGAIVLFTVAIEAVGAASLFAAFAREMPPREAAYHAVFHAVSAFSNAGFSTFSTNLRGYADSAWVAGTVMLLIVLGGLGFAVLAEVSGFLRGPGGRWSLHTRITLAATGALLAAGFAAFLVLEWNGAYAAADPRGKTLRAAFQSVTPRTAGFDTVEQAGLSAASLGATILLMFIGGGAGSTAGGVKVSTGAVLLLLLAAMLRGRERVDVGGREIPHDVVFRAMLVFPLAILACAGGAFALLLTEANGPALGHRGEIGLVFEVVSALGTVGLSTGVTPDLSAAGRCVIILLMLLGRVGPLGAVLAFAPEAKPPQYRYPHEGVMVG